MTNLDPALQVTKGKTNTPIHAYVEVDNGAGVFEPLDSEMAMEVYVVFTDTGERYLVGQGSTTEADTNGGGASVLAAYLSWTVPNGAPAGEAGVELVALGNEYAGGSSATFGL